MRADSFGGIPGSLVLTGRGHEARQGLAAGKALRAVSGQRSLRGEHAFQSEVVHVVCVGA